MYRHDISVALLALGCVIVGAVGMWLVPQVYPDLASSLGINQSAAALTAAEAKAIRGATVRQSSVAYDHISPLLACDIGSEDLFPEFAPLKDSLNRVIAQEQAAGRVQNVSIYLRSMLSSRWIEIGGTQQYTPASLFKIFIMMAYYKEADETDNPGLLQKQIAFQGTANYVNDVVGGTIVHLVNGQLYSVDQVINQMITYSDNDALNTLLQNFDSDTLARLQTIFQDLNIPLPLSATDSSVNFISAENYGLVFRVLFGSTYLSERYSEKALSILGQTKYTDGIVAGVPKGFEVAHKYGVAITPATATTTVSTQLHDCGIVYYPKHPYLLCVMTRGNDLAGQQKAIADISTASYAWLDVFFKTNSASTTATTTPVKP